MVLKAEKMRGFRGMTAGCIKRRYSRAGVVAKQVGWIIVNGRTVLCSSSKGAAVLARVVLSRYCTVGYCTVQVACGDL